MKQKPEIIIEILKESQGYSCTSHFEDRFIGVESESMESLLEEMTDAVNFALEDLGLKYSKEDFVIKYDLESFFTFYRVINVKALAEKIGMNQSLLAQYIKGKKTPSARQTKRILLGVHQIGRELSEANFLLK